MLYGSSSQYGMSSLAVFRSLRMISSDAVDLVLDSNENWKRQLNMKYVDSTAKKRHPNRSKLLLMWSQQ